MSPEYEWFGRSLTDSTCGSSTRSADVANRCAGTLNAVQQGFRDRAKLDELRFLLVTNSECWFVLAHVSDNITPAGT